MIASLSWETIDTVGYETVRILLSVLWQATILLGTVGLLTYVLRRRRASVRHRLWVAALLIAPLLPLFTWLAEQAGTPQVKIPLIPIQRTERPAMQAGSGQFRAPAERNTVSSATAPPERIDAPRAPDAVAALVAQSQAPASPTPRISPWAWGLLIYLAGVGLVLCLVAFQRMRIGRWLRRGQILTEPRIVEAFKAAQRALGLARGCVVVEIEDVEAPLTIRTFYPVVALPKGFAAVLSETELQTMALHEMAHIKRNDPLVLTLVSLIRAVLFFHPLVWLAAREISTLSEEATDDAVLEAVDEPLPYAKMLTRLAEYVTQRMLATELAIGIVFSKNALLRRIEAILSERSDIMRRLSARGLAATVAIWFCALALAVAFPLTQAGPAAKDAHAAGMVQRHVWNVPPESSLSGGVSLDGRYVSYVDWTAGNLAVYDMVEDRNWLVTRNTDSTWKDIDGWAESSVLSPDGRRIAYSWFNERGVDYYDLRIINLDGTGLRVLYHDPAVFWINPYAWSPDGRHVLAYFSDADRNLVDQKTGELHREAYFVLISVADATVRILKTWRERGCPKTAVFSPDGRYIAYDVVQRDDPARYDILLMGLDGGSETPLIEHPADDRLLGWAPNGQSIVFTSDRTSRRGLWMIEVEDGMAGNSPVLLKREFTCGPLGFTSNGSFYYSVSTKTSDVYVARIDATGMRFEDRPRLASSHFVGSTSLGDWSPDGRLLVYKTRLGGRTADPLASETRIFVVFSAASGEERVLTPSPALRPSGPLYGLSWSPNGRDLLVHGKGREGGYSLYTVDVETGAATLAVSNRDERLAQSVWSADGQSIYTRSSAGISQFDLTTGQETKLYPGKWGPVSLDVSPDGRWLAFYRDQTSLVIAPSGGGEVREVVRTEEGELAPAFAFVTWTPDGQHLLFCRRRNELWKVHIDSGVQQQIDTAIDKGRLLNAVMHPDGRQIAFTVQQPGAELWVMENFLPE